MKWSANLGFLWTDRSLADAIYAAHAAGFDAVECHWPYDQPVQDVRQALADTGMPMLGLNTHRGDVAAGDNGLLAIPDREDEAKDAIEQALDYAAEVGAKAVHLMAGKADGSKAHDQFSKALTFAASKASPDMTLLIEPLNPHDAPGYFLKSTDQAVEIMKDIGAKNLKLMFDCYHVARTEGDVLAKLDQHWDHIGHIQFAGVPDRGRPDVGQLDYAPIFEHIIARGWDRPLGAEYKPDGATENSLGWMTAYDP